VDYVSGAVVALVTAHGAANADGSVSASANLSGSVYQYVNTAGSPKFDDVGLWIGKAGYACKAVPYAEFSRILRENTSITTTSGGREGDGDGGGGSSGGTHALAPLLAYFPVAAVFPDSMGMQVWGDSSTRQALRLLSHDPASVSGAPAPAALGPTFSAASSVAAAAVEPELPEPGMPVSSRLVLRPPRISCDVIRRTLLSLALRGHAPPPPTTRPATLGSESSSEDESEAMGGAVRPAASLGTEAAHATTARGGSASLARTATRSLGRMASGAAPVSGEAVFGKQTRIATAVAPAVLSASAAVVGAAESSADTPRAPSPTLARTHARTVRVSNAAKLARLASAVADNPDVDFDTLVRSLDD
jgi:hypothetical protein